MQHLIATGMTENGSLERSSLGIQPDLAAQLIHLLRSVVVHVLLQDLFAERVLLEAGAATDVPVCEENLHVLYRHTVISMEVTRTLARFQGVGEEQLQERLVDCSVTRIRDLFVSNGASKVVSVMMSYALRVLSGSGSASGGSGM